MGFWNPKIFKIFLEVKFMAMFMAHLTHPVEACYVVNEETKKKLKELSSKREEIAKKHEIKVITAVYPPLEHEIFYVMEAPSFRNVELYLREMGFALYNKIKIRHVQSMEKALDVLQK
jgi:predicted nuclease with RNAse H fold